MPCRPVAGMRATRPPARGHRVLRHAQRHAESPRNLPSLRLSSGEGHPRPLPSAVSVLQQRAIYGFVPGPTSGPQHRAYWLPMHHLSSVSLKQPWCRRAFSRLNAQVTSTRSRLTRPMLNPLAFPLALSLSTTAWTTPERVAEARPTWTRIRCTSSWCHLLRTRLHDAARISADMHMAKAGPTVQVCVYVKALHNEGPSA